MQLYAFQCENGVEKNQRTAWEKVHTATINSHPAVRPNWSHRRVFTFNSICNPKVIQMRLKAILGREAGVD